MTKKMMNPMSQSNPRVILARPFARRLTPDPDGGYVATIQEFPGCIAEGDTADEALANLDAAAESWIEARLEQGQPIPEPVDFHGYSGKIALRIPRGVHKQVAELAASERTSINQLILSAVSSYLGAYGVLNVCRDVTKRMQDDMVFRALPVNTPVTIMKADVYRMTDQSFATTHTPKVGFRGF